jgi:AraC-like DNA-binding protein
MTQLGMSLAETANMPVEVRDGALMLPVSLGKGRFEFYELTEGLSVILADMTFYRTLRFIQRAVPGNEHYIAYFDVSGMPVLVSKQSGRVVDTGSDLAEAVLFCSHDTSVSVTTPADGAMRQIWLIFDHAWLVRNLLHHMPVALSVQRIRQMINSEPIQFTTNLDLDGLHCVEEAFGLEMPAYVRPLYLEGIMMQLSALFFKTIVEEELGELRIVSESATRVMKLKEQLEKSYNEAMPSLMEAAQQCLMSRTKFAGLFFKLYGQNYGSFFKELRLRKAAELLRKGLSVMDVVQEVGYLNVGHFAREFKKQYKVSPKLYQAGLADPSKNAS